MKEEGMEVKRSVDYNTILQQNGKGGVMNGMTHNNNTINVMKIEPVNNTKGTNSNPIVDDKKDVKPVIIEQTTRRERRNNSSNLQTFGKQSFTAEERERIKNLLQQRLTAHDVQTRPGAAGGSL